MDIFNRWGLIIYSTTDPRTGWDGSYKGVIQPNDNYIWIIKLVDMDGNMRSYKGNVLLLK
jgi:gliding motility-associated-like protein